MTVKAIDIGYGNVKYVTGRKGGEVQCAHFPSVAPPSSGRDFGAGVATKKDVVKVCVGDSLYIVGPDASLSLPGGKSGRKLIRDYPETDGYLALARGALAYAGDREIDLLVTGLPVNYHAAYRDKLESKLAGEHAYPDGSSIVVKKAWAVPQPIGGFVHYAIQSGLFDELRETHCLVIDVGFFTVDWLVCRGLKVLDERSGSVAGGMSKILSRVAEEISAATGEAFADINRVDAALRQGGKLEWYGRPYELKKFLPKCKPVFDEVMEAIMESVGTLDDIASVILVGGGTAHYLEPLRAICHRNPLLVPDEGIYANVRGFYEIGERRAKRHG